MTVTSAILEFLVLGCLWLLVFLVAIFVAVAGWSGTWPEVALGGSNALWSLLGIPVAYAVGVVLQAATWVLWYKRVHRKALAAEVGSRHRAAYQRLADALKARGVAIGLPDGRLERGEDLGGLLDVLRWELLMSPRTEAAHQYLVQFHLYRVLYGSVLPYFALSLLLATGALTAGGTGPAWLAPAFTLAALFSLILALMAWKGAAHRRSRTWKYLVFGAQALEQVSSGQPRQASS